MKTSYLHFILALSLFGLTAVGYGVWYVYVANETGVAASLAESIAAKTESVENTAALKKTLDKLAADEAAVHAYFVSESNIVSFLSKVEALGSMLGTRVKVLSVGMEKGTPPMLGVTLQVAGSFDGVVRTVGAIEYAPYAISVKNISLVQNSDTTAPWVASLSLSVGSRASSTPQVEAPQTPPPSSNDLPTDLL